MRGSRGISVCLGKSKAYFSEFYYVNSNFLNFQGAGVQTFPFPTLYRSAYMYEYIYFCIHFKPLIKHYIVPVLVAICYITSVVDL